MAAASLLVHKSPAAKRIRSSMYAVVGAAAIVTSEIAAAQGEYLARGQSGVAGSIGLAGGGGTTVMAITAGGSYDGWFDAEGAIARVLTGPGATSVGLGTAVHLTKILVPRSNVHVAGTLAVLSLIPEGGSAFNSPGTNGKSERYSSSAGVFVYGRVRSKNQTQSFVPSFGFARSWIGSSLGSGRLLGDEYWLGLSYAFGRETQTNMTLEIQVGESESKQGFVGVAIGFLSSAKL